jgi:protein-disulfide isomerase
MPENKLTSYFSKLVPVLSVLVIILIVFVGLLWRKVNILEKGGISASPVAQASPLEVAKIKGYAKDLKLDTKKFNTCLDSGQVAQTVKDDIAYGGQVGVSGTPAFFINGHLVSGALPYDVFKNIIDFELKGGNWAKPDTTVASYVDPKNPLIDVKKVSIDLGNSPREGASNAQVVIVEFSDFQCPYCERFYTQTEGQIKSNYIDTDKVLLVFKQFPLSFHQYAEKAAEASLCANLQGKFWEMHNKLFEVSSTAQ